ncbi:MAG: HAD hydrolase-like protein [Spirochaetaceae bacterium]|jgi:phosphoglycolate phosphatase|nr:HAD hydrolase-like protein [Spirochaetaceae bacterium]
MEYHVFMKYSSILFDLDGTLTDSYPGIKNSIKYSLQKFDISEEDDEKLKAFVGAPLEKSFMKYYGFDKGTARKAVEHYREYFQEKGMYENRLYDGTEELLRALNGKNAVCIIATSKSVIFARKILEHFRINVHFRHIAGSGPDGASVEKEGVIRLVIEKYGLNRRKTIMIGDRKYDISGANKNGIDSIAVLYGYGSREELEKASPKYLCGSVTDISKILTKRAP